MTDEQTYMSIRNPTRLASKRNKQGKLSEKEKWPQIIMEVYEGKFNYMDMLHYSHPSYPFQKHINPPVEVLL